MTIIFACDHAGFVLKQKLINWLGAKSDVVVIDVGATTKNKKDDYVDLDKRIVESIYALNSSK